MTTLALDLSGSDLGAQGLSKAVLQYGKDHPSVSFLIFGKNEEVTPLFQNAKNCKVVPCSDVIPMEIKPLDFLRRKDSSLYQAIAAVKDGKADGIVTAGSTGGFVVGTTILLRNIEGVTRAGLCSPFPTAVKDRGAVILDIGASNVNTGEDLYGFARMGRIYSQSVLEVVNPTTAVLSNGTEEGKGTQEVVDAYHLLKENNFSGFQGNVEARDALDGTHDVIVTSGFAGNIFLKATEGMAGIMNDLIKKSFKKNLLTKIGYVLSQKGFKDMKTTMDYRRFGGAILLGLNGVAVKAHGNSNAYAFYNAIRVADGMISKNIVAQIKEAFHA